MVLKCKVSDTLRLDLTVLSRAKIKNLMNIQLLLQTKCFIQQKKWDKYYLHANLIFLTR